MFPPCSLALQLACPRKSVRPRFSSKLAAIPTSLPWILSHCRRNSSLPLLPFLQPHLQKEVSFEAPNLVGGSDPRPQSSLVRKESLPPRRPGARASVGPERAGLARRGHKNWLAQGLSADPGARSDESTPRPVNETRSGIWLVFPSSHLSLSHARSKGSYTDSNDRPKLTMLGVDAVKRLGQALTTAAEQGKVKVSPVSCFALCASLRRVPRPKDSRTRL